VDLIATIRPEHANAAFTLIGFSGGGAFTIRIAGGPHGDLFNRYIVISPAKSARHWPQRSAICRPREILLSSGWANFFLWRIFKRFFLQQLQ
jgi:hypothetical protein